MKKCFCSVSLSNLLYNLELESIISANLSTDQNSSGNVNQELKGLRKEMQNNQDRLDGYCLYL